MQQDQCGYPVTTSDAGAIAALDLALNAYVGFRTDTMTHLDAAIAADPEFALAHACRGILLAGLRKSEMFPLALNELEAAVNGRAPATKRELHYVKALKAALTGHITEAVAHYEQIVNDHPHDLFAMRLAQFELFWIGEVSWMRDISERAAPHWSPEVPRYANYLSIRAFGLEENGEYGHAENYGRESVERDATEFWGTHAVAHVLIMQGRLADGVEWLSGLSANWAGANHVVHHLWWHLALFQMEQGDYDAGLDIYDRRLRDLDSPLMQAIPDFYIDIQNDVSLLQRLELRGVDVADRWQPVAELAGGRIDNHTSPFTSAHCVLALAAAQRYQDAEKMIRRMRDFVSIDTGTFGPRYALAALPASEAAIAHRKGEHQQVVDILMPARRNLWQMGGSHAQRDLFFQLLIDSATRLGRHDLLAILLGELEAIGFDHLNERTSYAEAVNPGVSAAALQ
jgi:tetratricopeptide (TPR) repeat protein